MKELKSIFQPEVRPAHKVYLQIASHLIATAEDAKKGIIKAGTLLKAGTDDGKLIVHQPEKGAKVAVVADVDNICGVLAHDVEVEVADGKYPIGVIIEGVVYQDVMEDVNTKANFTETVISKLAERKITTYNVKTK